MEQPVISQDSAVVEARNVPADTVSDVSDELIDADPLAEQLEASDSADPEEVEDDIDGVKLRGKKDLIDKFRNERLMQADYTRKTQAVIQERQAMAQQADFNNRFLQEAATLKALDMRLSEYDKVDRRALIDADPAQAQKFSLEREDLAKTREQVLQSLNAKQAQTFHQQQAGLAALKEQAAAYLTKEIANWTPERDAAIAKYVVDKGVPPAAIANVMAHMPQFGVMAHKAELYDALVAKAAKKPPPDSQVAPITRVAATRATANKSPEQMSDAEFSQWRARQIKQRH